MGRQTLKLLDRLFPKKIRDKDVQKFWKEFEERADLYLTILKEDEEDSEDREWMDVLIKKCLGRVCVDADEPLDTHDRTSMLAVVAAMSRMENGREAVMSDVEAGWTLFIQHKP